MRRPNHTPDILDCIAHLSSDEVFTPPSVVNQMLDLLPVEVWSNPSYKWLDPASKTGIFLREIVKRLMHGLATWEPNETLRLEHIHKKMIFGAAITALTGELSRRTVYCSRDAAGPHAVVRFSTSEGNIPFVPAEHRFVRGSCEVCHAPEALERGEARENFAYSFLHDKYPAIENGEKMKFDVIVGNPPYQISDGSPSGSASPLYHLFVKQAIALNPRYLLMIIPSRWFVGGKGLDSFRAEMLADSRFRSIVDFQDASVCFPGINLQGGVNYFLWDRDYSGQCEITSVYKSGHKSTHTRPLGEFDVLIRSNESIPIVRKVRARGEGSFEDSIGPRKPFGFPSSFKGTSGAKPANAVTLYATRTVAWVDRSAITSNAAWVDQHKVFITKASDGNEVYPLPVLTQPIVAGPGTACTETYLIAGPYASQVEAENCAAYMRTRFFRFLLSLKKSTQNNSRDKFSFVPALDMKTRWTDEKLYKRYNLSVEEIEFIESQIREMPTP